MPKSKAKSQNVIIMSRNWNEGWKASCRIGRYSWPASVTITPQGWAHQRPVSYAPRGVRPAKKCWQSGNQCQEVTPRSKGQNSSDMDFPKKMRSKNPHPDSLIRSRARILDLDLDRDLDRSEGRDSGIHISCCKKLRWQEFASKLVRRVEMTKIRSGLW